jgi:acetoin utilization deacetylase AcuC-like enzyme
MADDWKTYIDRADSDMAPTSPDAPSSSPSASLKIVASDAVVVLTDRNLGAQKTVLLGDDDLRLDALDDFNHTRQRRAKILEALFARMQAKTKHGDKEGAPADPSDESSKPEVTSITWNPAPAATSLDFYKAVHSEGLLTFLQSAYDRWESLGPEGRDEIGCLNPPTTTGVPPLVPHCMPLARVEQQRPSQHVMGQVGYYCNDRCTPIFDVLRDELWQDAGVVEAAVQHAINDSNSSTVFAVPTHPGHHAAKDSYGGYCYVNHAAAMTRQLQQVLSQQQQGDTTSSRPPVKVAILDVDYHCGNGTASIFDADPSVLVVSLHCDPDHDYPFHSGFADQTGPAGATLHLPLPPGTVWKDYEKALLQGLEKVMDFEAQAVVVSLGLDTHAQDPCAIRRAGFLLEGQDYVEMGRLIGERTQGLPLIFMQEGGYRMDVVADAAADVVTSCHAARQVMPANKS